MFPVQLGVQMKNRSSYCAHNADRPYFWRITGNPDVTRLGSTIQNQSASKYYGDALPYPRPVYSVTGISKELRIFSHLSLTIRRSSLGAAGNFFRKHRGRDRQRPCPCRARESLAAFALRYPLHGTLVCAPGRNPGLRGDIGPAERAWLCWRSLQAALSKCGMLHGTASIRGRLCRTKPVYTPRESARRSRCSS